MVGKGCGTLFVIVAAILLMAPLVWLAREAFLWALGL
jgi:hypothetical protein